MPFKYKWPYQLLGFSIIVGFILTIISWLDICKSACAESHHYRLYHLPFEISGIIYFTSLLTLYVLSIYRKKLTYIIGLMLIGGLGAETLFILFQKFVIGALCPICLSIAFSVVVATFAFYSHNKLNLKPNKKQKNGEIMRIFNKLSPYAIYALGFIVAFSGISKVDINAAEERVIAKKLTLGNQESPISVYIFTSWACPACKHMEPNIENMLPEIMSKAKVIFVDDGDDSKSLNYLPYNLSFILNNPSQYPQLRHALRELANRTNNPTDAEVEKAAAKLGVKYEQLPYADVSLATAQFKELSSKYHITALPSLVVVNGKNQKKFVGGDINDKVLKAIDTFK